MLQISFIVAMGETNHLIPMNWRNQVHLNLQFLTTVLRPQNLFDKSLHRSFYCSWLKSFATLKLSHTW